jgi:cell wall-associated NlpC family hydrolase
MSVNGRSPSKLLVFALALPVFALVYVTTFGARLWAALRPAVATFLGVSVIGSVYAETAYRKTPTPIRAAAVVALSVVLVAPQFAAPQRVAAADPADTVIAAAKQYLGHHFQIGAEGPGQFDCSGLVFRAFSDAGELPRIGGMRLRAAGYMQYFVSRGRFTRDESQAERGDLVIYADGEHVGIYLGDDKVISALIDPWGVSITHVHSLHLPVSYYLKVNWGGGDSGDNNGDGNGPGNGGDNGNGGSGNSIDGPSNVGPGPDGGDNTGGDNNGNGGDNNGGDGTTGGDNNGNGGDGTTGGDNGGQGVTGGHGTSAIALGTMNVRNAADPSAQIIGWIGRGGSFNVVDQGTSPAGYVWFKVQTKSGKEGWVYSRWVKELN